MRVSVIIPAYSMERLDDIQRALVSLCGQTFLPNEVVVAVDHNRELVDELARLYRMNRAVKVVLNDGVIGGAETRNAGIKSSSGEIVAFLDDDAVAGEGWLENLVAQYADPDVMAVGGKTISVWDNGRPSWFPEELDWVVGGIWKGHPEGLCEVRNLIGPNMSFRKSVCDRMGYMRSELGAMPNRARAGDEVEFYMRMKHLIPEGKIIYEPRAVVRHRVYPHKATVKHLLVRSCSDGYYKSRSAKVFADSLKKPFRLEATYLRYLLLNAIPSRVAKFYVGGNIGQCVAIVASIVAFGCGYLWGIVKR